MTGRTAVGRTFVDPRSLVFWVFLGLTAYGAVQLFPLVVEHTTDYPGTSLAAAVLWAVYGLALVVLLYKLELFGRRSPVTILGAFLWGAVVVAGIAAVSSSAFTGLVAEITTKDAEWGGAISAPLLEEPLKLLGVVALALIPGSRITSALDGLFFGLIVGLGFEVTESFLYTAKSAADEMGSFAMVLTIFVLRGFIGGLWSHPTFTGISGAGVGYFFDPTRPRGRRILALVGGLLAAMLLHGFFDTDLFAENALVASVVKGLPALLFLLVLLRLARNRARRAFSRVAEGSVPADLVSDEEREILLSGRARRRVRKKMRAELGRKAGRDLRRLQMAQVALVEATGRGDSEQAAEAAERVRTQRAALAHTGVV